MQIEPMADGKYALKRKFDNINFSPVGEGRVAVVLNGIVVGFVRVGVANYEEGERVSDSGDRFVDFEVNTDACCESCRNCAYVVCDKE